jgi:hypothetical protein
VKLIQACSPRPEFIAEAKIGNQLNMERLHKVLRDSQSFGNVTYLHKVGVLRALYRGKSIILFKNGRITVNCVIDAKEASDIVYLLIKTLKVK